MYTTPRKVKQESRLRRSMSLTNNGNNRMNGTDLNGNDDSCGLPIPSTTSPYYTLSNRQHYGQQHLNGIAELPVSGSSSCPPSKGIIVTDTSRNSFSYCSDGSIIIPDVIDVSQQPDGGTSLDFHNPYSSSSYSGPPPYRNPPRQQLSPGESASALGPESPDAYHTHSAKFPIVKEVIISETTANSPLPPTSSSSSSHQENPGASQPPLAQLQPRSSISSETSLPPIPPAQQTALLTPEYIKRFRNKKLTKHLAWKDDRRALTLDSERAKELQNQLVAQQQKSALLSAGGTSTIRRSGSAFELEKLIEAFNQEQHALVMSSMQNGITSNGAHTNSQPNSHLRQRSFNGIDSSSGETINRHLSTETTSFTSSQQSRSTPGGKMAGYTFSDSSASQSLSLSSSNTDSLDTVIYKGPNGAAPSIRDWQRSKDALQQANFGDSSNSTSAPGYRGGGDSQGMFDSRAYPMQQASSSPAYQAMQFNGPGGSGNGMMSGQTPSASGAANGYSMEYRHQPVQQQHHHGQNMPVHQSSQLHSHQQQQQHQTGMMMRQQHNGPAAGAQFINSNGQNGHLPGKSPMVMHKSLIPSPVTSASGQNGSNLVKASAVAHGSDSVCLDKAKDSTKMFPSKTYNHIKDMISSRFGNTAGNGNAPTSNLGAKGLNNTATMNNNNSGGSGNSSNQNGGYGHMNGSNGYMESVPTSSYGVNQHGHMHSHSASDSYNGGNTQAAPYYTSPPAVSPQQNGNGASVANGGANSYRSPQMNDRKNVNTSFRKAIHQSTLKSNLAEESLQLRPIMESSSMNGSGGNGRDLYREPPRYNGMGGGHHQEPPSPSLIPHHVERAQRALDKLCEPGSSSQGGPSFTRTGSGPMTHHHPHQQQNGIINRAFSGEESVATTSSNNNNNRPNMYSMQKLGGMASSSSGQLSDQQLGVSLARNRFSVTPPGPSSSTSSSSAGATLTTTTAAGASAQIESSLSSPSAPTTSLHTGNLNNKCSEPPQLQPPPLPTSQKPEASGVHTLSFTQQPSSSNSSHQSSSLGLPPVLPSVLVGEKRENGDGSSGTMENPSSSSPSNLEQNPGQGGPGGGQASSSTLAVNKSSKTEQLKKITADLHNLAISVAAEQQHYQQPQPFHHHLSQFSSGNNNQQHQNSSSSECEKGQQRIGSGQSHTASVDSGVMLTKSPLNSISDHEINGKSDRVGDLIDDHHLMDSVSSGNDSEWVDIVEPEIRQILELEKKSKAGKSRLDKMALPNGNGLATSTPAVHQAQVHHHPSQGKGPSTQYGRGTGSQSDLMADITASPILHHRMVSGSPTQSPNRPKKFDLNVYNKKSSQNRSQEMLPGPSTSGNQNGAPSTSNKVKSPRVSAKVHRSNSGAQRHGRGSSRADKVSKSSAAAANRLIKDLGLKGIKLSRHAASQILYPHDDNGDMTSTTTGLDLESMLDGQTEHTSDDDDDMSTTIDTTDAHAIRRQLESLESMYTEVLKVLGGKRFSGGSRYPTSDLRNAKRRPYGSMSSLPSSVSSRPFRERKLKLDDKKKVKDIKSINKRFQRLEAHVVTLARSVAHLSSEMRTQHLMVQEIESIRSEMQQLRNQVLKSSMQNQSAAAAAAHNFARMSSGRNGGGNMVSATDWSSFRNALPSLTNPCRVRKLTKFFGDEPPLVRIFLKKLGYEKYASAFEQERIGIMELPYLTEERLNKMGIPMGPRLRILQEAQLCLKPGYHPPPNHDSQHHSHHQSSGNHGPGNLSVYVV